MNKISLSNLMDIKILFNDCQKIILNDYIIKLIKNGVYLDHRQIITQKPFIVMNSTNEWVAYYQPIRLGAKEA
ncbi:MAG: hypothetical protein Q8764_02870 [Pigeon pea little leaf phytoplasma]|uniref:Uncharacterized protein n=1 Tax=Candidatus Phytoplasma fabacearum TaxID=2982628 RepID=A0ABU8ZT79_9MOLU|nr:hypothetical protein ['Bituminaria bituminosa' little leaf phytoplasma]MDV3149128.1 hypothetical protein [Pigeon pea little leaf phytoplasma]MDV3197986.1 hypothetical protein [Candidatus Phytoplasma australasiaticum]MDO8023975.1 hypothetical protein ['Bituminaria bituminosa' little leaf phytoplasma]MDO8030861.1 hypothetical protein ['Bituminaria bituminosa' little leaf phytoplasma]MDV3154303.1 hypothetical protein [Pigeon pea little leaf phytoplasma]